MQGFGAWVAFVGCLLAVVAGADAGIFQRVSDGKAETSSDVIARIDRLAAEQASGRRDFETRGAYQARIARAEEAPQGFRISPLLVVDATDVDPTGLGKQRCADPLRLAHGGVARARRKPGKRRDPTELCPHPPDQVRLMDTFPQSITLRLVFGVSRAKRMLIESMTLRFQGDIIYEEP